MLIASVLDNLIGQPLQKIIPISNYQTMLTFAFHHLMQDLTLDQYDEMPTCNLAETVHGCKSQVTK